MTDEQYLSWITAGGAQRERGVRGLFERYGARLKAFFRRHGCSDEDAADLLQETFVRLVRAADTFRQESQVSTWLWTIARNCLHDHWRARHPDVSLDALRETDGDAWELALGVAEPEHEQRALQECVRAVFFDFARRFPENAQALQLAAVEGWTMEELGAFLGRTANATKEFVSQCKKRLRPFMERCRELLGL